MLMKRGQSCLVIIDAQERLVPAMSDPRRVIYNCGRLMQAAQRLGVPIVVSEQYPEGIGPTMVDLRPFLPEEGAVPKLEFSLTASAEAMRRIEASGRGQMIVVGTEAHICVLQTALSFKERGLDVFVVADAVASRKVENERLAMDRLRQSGVFVVGTEMVLFEWLGQAGTPEFKALMPMIK
jgi:nicotinamidase-related amidase